MPKCMSSVAQSDHEEAAAAVGSRNRVQGLWNKDQKFKIDNPGPNYLAFVFMVTFLESHSELTERMRERSSRLGVLVIWLASVNRVLEE